jgi:hypothetical protein
MQSSSARADARTVIRLFATVVGAAFLLSGCNSEEGTRARELLQQAEQAQAKLQSATFEANLGFVMDGAQVEVAIEGAASKEGAAFSLYTTGIPEAAGRDFRLVVRGNRAWMRDTGGSWTSMPVPTQMNGMSSSMGADAFQELARYVRDVRVSEHQQFAGKPVTTITGEIDTAGMLKAVTKLGSVSGSGSEEGAFSLDFDDLGVKLGDIKAVLSIDEGTQLLTAAGVTFAIEARGEKVELDLQYRLTSSNQPVKLPSVSG